MKRFYFLSKDEYDLIQLFDLGRFLSFVPADENDYWIDIAIAYDDIDQFARTVFARKNKGSNYDKLVSFVERLQEILEKNDDLC